MNSQARRALVKKPVDHVDLALQWFERRERFAQLHLRTRSLGSPVILVDTATEKDYSKSFRERFGAGGRSLGGERFEPRQRQGASRPAKNRAAGDAIGRWIHSIRHLKFPPFRSSAALTNQYM